MKKFNKSKRSYSNKYKYTNTGWYSNEVSYVYFSLKKCYTINVIQYFRHFDP